MCDYVCGPGIRSRKRPQKTTLKTTRVTFSGQFWALKKHPLKTEAWPWPVRHRRPHAASSKGVASSPPSAASSARPKHEWSVAAASPRHSPCHQSENETLPGQPYKKEPHDASGSARTPTPRSHVLLRICWPWTPQSPTQYTPGNAPAQPLPWWLGQTICPPKLRSPHPARVCCCAHQAGGQTRLPCEHRSQTRCSKPKQLADSEARVRNAWSVQLLVALAAAC